MPSKPPPSGYKGRGALSNPANRFDRQHAESIDDGWFQEAVPSAIPTEVKADATRTSAAGSSDAITATSYSPTSARMKTVTSDSSVGSGAPPGLPVWKVLVSNSTLP
jgi:hypothetical protein